MGSEIHKNHQIKANKRKAAERCNIYSHKHSKYAFDHNPIPSPANDIHKHKSFIQMLSGS